MNRLTLIVAFVLVLLAPAPSRAADWGAIVPGESTMSSVRAEYGEPTRTTPSKVEGYDVVQWVYDGDRAPRGMRKMTVDFGLLTEQGFKPDVVRVLTLEPKPVVFTRQTVLLGWGEPTRVGSQPDGELFFYQEGLVVEFDKQGWQVRRMTFTLRQPNVD